MDNREEIGKALGKIPSGVGVLTVRHGEEEAAMLASWFQQAAFEPPMITVAVNKKRPIAALISAAKTFSLSLFHTNQKDLFARFAKGFQPGENPFEGVKVTHRKTQNPVLGDAMAYLDCELVNVTDAGDHTICLGRIIDGGLLSDGHSMVHTRRNGFNY